MVIYIIDYDNPIQVTRPYLSTSGVKALKAEKGNSFSLIFSRALNLVYEPVELLRIAAHMNSGVIALANQVFSLGDAKWFKLFRDIWSDDTDGIELHGCGVASDIGVMKRPNPPTCQLGRSEAGGRGQTFLQAVADAAGTKVTGPINCQKADKWYRWEGPTVTLKPARAYSWKGPLILTADGKPWDGKKPL